MSVPAPLRRPAAPAGDVDVLSALRELRAAIAPDLAVRAGILAVLRAEFHDTVFSAEHALERAAEKPAGQRASP